MRSFEHGYLYETPISHQLVMTMRALGEFRGRHLLYARQAPELLEALRRTAVIQSTESSNRIEGITVDPERLQALVSKTTRPRDRSEQEVAGYRDVLAEIHTGHGRMRLTTELILDWHRKIYRYTGDPAGHWKKTDNAIVEIRPDGRPVVRFQPVSALATPKFIARLVEFFQRELAQGKADPLFLIAAFILDFECIHPFSDGNGRIGRLLTLLLLYQNGYETGRYISLERTIEQSKETYYDALNKSSLNWHQGQHDLRPWWEYFLGTLIAAAREFEDRVGTITSARGAKREMVKNAVRRLPARFSIAELQEACPGVSYPTLRRTLLDLAKKGQIRCLGRGPKTQWERLEG